MNEFKEREYLKKEQLVIGGKYFCDGRNFEYGIWNGEAFEYERTKWGIKFQDTELHWDDGAPFGTVKPFELVVNLKGKEQE